MPHGSNIYVKASDMAKATMCTYPQSDNVLPHCKCVLQLFAKFLCINLPDQKTNIRTLRNNTFNKVSHLSHHWTLY